MKMTRREFLAVGAALALSACGGSKEDDHADDEVVDDAELESEPKQDPEPEPENEEATLIEVEDTTYYDVFRCDWREGVFGDVEVYTINTTDFSGSYAMLSPDGTFSSEINGVVYNGKISLGGKTTHLYSGMEDAEVTRILFDGNEDATVGAVDIEGFYVDNYILIEQVAQVDGKTVFATFYLWKHVDE